MNIPENLPPKGVTVGFATCLLFVFLTIPTAIAAKVLYGVSLADSDWLHGSAESMLTVTNLITVLAFRQALNAKEQEVKPPRSATEYGPMIVLTGILTALAGVTAFVPAIKAQRSTRRMSVDLWTCHMMLLQILDGVSSLNLTMLW